MQVKPWVKTALRFVEVALVLLTGVIIVIYTQSIDKRVDNLEQRPATLVERVIVQATPTPTATPSATPRVRISTPTPTVTE